MATGDALVGLIIESKVFLKETHVTMALCRGTLGLSDQLDIPGPDGHLRRAVVGSIIPPSRKDKLRPTLKAGERVDAIGEVGDLDGRLDGISADQLHPGETVRFSGASWPIALDEESDARRRIMDAIQASRAAGTMGVSPEGIPLAHVYDETIVLFVEKRLRDAALNAGNAIQFLCEMQKVAELLDAIGMPADADRHRLAGAAALEGFSLSPVVSLLALVSLEVLGGLQSAGAAQGHLRAISAFETSDVYRSAFDYNIRNMGAEIRRELQAQGRAVAYGVCPACRQPVALDLELRCANCRELANPTVVATTADGPRTWEQLSRYRPQ